MKKLTTTSFAILSLLALRPWSAYELSQQMRRSVGEFWPRAERGIYDEPKVLVAHGFASATEEAVGRRSRTVYAITPAGRNALSEWLARPSQPPQFESEALLRIAFAEHGSKPAALATLAQLREQAGERRRVVTDVARDYLEGRGPYPDRVHVITLVMRFFADYFDLLDSWAAWAADEIAEWDEGTTADPGRAATAQGALALIAALRPFDSLLDSLVHPATPGPG